MKNLKMQMALKSQLQISVGSKKMRQYSKLFSITLAAFTLHSTHAHAVTRQMSYPCASGSTVSAAVDDSCIGKAKKAACVAKCDKEKSANESFRSQAWTDAYNIYGGFTDSDDCSMSGAGGYGESGGEVCRYDVNHCNSYLSSKGSWVLPPAVNCDDSDEANACINEALSQCLNERGPAWVNEEHSTCTAKCDSVSDADVATLCDQDVLMYGNGSTSQGLDRCNDDAFEKAAASSAGSCPSESAPLPVTPEIIAGGLPDPKLEGYKNPGEKAVADAVELMGMSKYFKGKASNAAKAGVKGGSRTGTKGDAGGPSGGAEQGGGPGGTLAGQGFTGMGETTDVGNSGLTSPGFAKNDKDSAKTGVSAAEAADKTMLTNIAMESATKGGSSGYGSGRAYDTGGSVGAPGAGSIRVTDSSLYGGARGPAALGPEGAHDGPESWLHASKHSLFEIVHKRYERASPQRINN